MAIAPHVIIHQIPEEEPLETLEETENEKYFEMNSKSDEIHVVDEFLDVKEDQNILNRNFSSQTTICSEEKRIWQVNHIGMIKKLNYHSNKILTIYNF